MNFREHVFLCTECGEPVGARHSVWCPYYEPGDGVGDDVRGSFESEHPPSWHRQRLDRAVRGYWRWLWVILAILVLGTLAQALGWT